MGKLRLTRLWDILKSHLWYFTYCDPAFLSGRDLCTHHIYPLAENHRCGRTHFLLSWVIKPTSSQFYLRTAPFTFTVAAVLLLAPA